VVTSIVARLDGLPLAIELAAAKVRAMSLEEIDRRLEDRFALLRGGDRSAPDRHQTLLAVIDWSWNLLNAAERRALRWLALFQDGFTLDGAEVVLGGDAIDTVQGLVDQSLLSVRETRFGARYRMLETVREFGLMRLAEAGEESAARAAQRQWATGYADAHNDWIAGHDQFAAIDALAAEETNLADELRAAIADGDRCSLVRLLAPLGLFWTIRGEHIRLLVMADAIASAVADWQPPPEVADTARAAVAVTLANTLMANTANAWRLRDLLQRLGPDSGADARVTGLARVMLAFDPADPDGSARRLERLMGDDNRHSALLASQWLSHLRENAGDTAGAMEAAQRSLELALDDDGPWAAVTPRTMLAQLSMNRGDRAAAIEHASAALPVLERLGASDDEIQLRATLALCAIADGRLADAEDELVRLDRVDRSRVTFGGDIFGQVCRAELALARGDYATGLRIHRECAVRMREFQLPGIPKTEMEPWALFGESMALAAHAFYATGDDVAPGRALYLTCRASALRVLSTGGGPQVDYPATGMLLAALTTWTLLRRVAPAQDAVRLFALADRFSFIRTTPTMTRERIAPVAEEAAPGLLA
ncbi:MAG TPA: transcriptional regulator, partial [Trebonia sp.]|nr:transcriptional regulator [Trebonia sp.]